MAAQHTQVKRLRPYYRKTITGSPWYGPGVASLLRNVKAKDAIAKPIDGAHSIWELVLHMITWKAGPLRGIHGSRKAVSKTENFPRIKDSSERAWKAAVAKLKATQSEWDAMLAAATDDTLDEPAAPSRKFKRADLYLGVLQHDTYHAGQIAILKRALGIKV
ncbi:DinB family protein [candidate division KSB1 bacterium]|nr:DinB family protein [candidate division KSB1 bacterium]